MLISAENTKMLKVTQNMKNILMHMYAAAAESLQSCLTLCDPIDGSPPGCPIPGILQAKHWSGLPFPSLMHESESEISQSDPQRPHGLHPSRLLHPWDFPGKNAKVNLLIAAKLVNIIIYIYIYICHKI